MNTKISAIIFVLFTTASVAAETNEVEAYYMVHQDEALEVYNVCKALMKEFAEEGDLKSIAKLADDQQCNAANKAVNLIASAE